MFDPLKLVAFTAAVYRLLRRRRGKLLKPEQIFARLEICKSCPQFTGDYCKLCGCCVNQEKTFFNKVAYPTEKCPSDPPKWSEVDV